MSEETLVPEVEIKHTTPHKQKTTSIKQTNPTKVINDLLNKKLDKEEFANLLVTIANDGTSTQKATLEWLKAFVSNMVASRTETDYAKCQQFLFLKLNSLLSGKVSAEEFEGAWSLLLRYAHFNPSDVFSPKKMYCGYTQWARSSEDLTNLRYLVTIILNTADASNMANGLKKLSIQTATSGLSDNAQQVLMAYYNKNVF